MSITTELLGGVQVSVETGTATVLSTQPKARNVEVTLDDPARRDSLKYALKGWIDKADTEALALAERVKGTAELVAYRIEVHRAKDIDPSLPITEVPATPQARHRRLVSLLPASAVATSGSAPEPMPWDNLPPRPAARNDARCNGSGPRVQEAKPWETINSDGSPNLGSYEVLAAVGMTELAHTLMLARAAEAGHQVFSIDTMRRLARTFLLAADRVQAAVRADGHADRMDNSHARARGAVRTALEAYPVPWEATVLEKAAWVEELVAWATEILRCALELATVPPVREISRTARTPAAAQVPESGILATEAERQAAIVAARQVPDGAGREQLEQFMRANGIPPLISPNLTSEQAMRVRAYLANVDGAGSAAA